MKGGGVLGIAYAGSLKVLEENNILQGIEKVAGTSAGSIVSTLVALKYTAKEIYDIVNTLDFKSFEDGLNPFRVISEYGLYKGDFALSWLHSIVDKKAGQNATFLDLRKQGFLDLHVIATNLRSRNYEIFSFDTTPDVMVAEAIRASMSIPIFFDAFKFSNWNTDTVYEDGGVMLNYPISIFDKTNAPSDTLGFYLHDVNQIANEPVSYGHLGEYIKASFDCSLSAQDAYVLGSPEILKRTIIIDDLGISATNFSLSNDQKQELYQSGITAAENYLKNKQL